ncbi:RIP metalloprotease RseP [Candidatus Parcubacteria bacterium]|nr:RIP metalloprotease RseP [Candidatus Parcubacteria bacterium]
MGTVLVFLMVLSLLVFVHEAGHFLVAKKMGMKVEEFGFGFPPRLVGVKRGGTTYSINWIPLGGFVRIKGESGDHRDEPDSFSSKSMGARFAVLVAGVVMNLALASVLLSIGFLSGLPSIVDDRLPASARVSEPALTIMAVVEGSPAAQAGVQQGDRVVTIDGEALTNEQSARERIAQSAEDGVALEIKTRAGDTQRLVLTSEPLAGQDLTGIGIGLVQTGIVSYPFFSAIVQGVAATVTFTAEVVKAFVGIIVHLATGNGLGMELSGPVGIAVLTGEVAALGLAYLLQFTALLSINLAVMNVLPFPALDGGRILFLCMEKVRGRAVNGNVETATHNIGFIVLILLVLLVTYRDVTSLLSS